MTEPRTCDDCDSASGVKLYEWPMEHGSPPSWLCAPCVSSSCEWCGLCKATLSVGTRPNWHLCATCRALPEFKRKRRVVAL